MRQEWAQLQVRQPFGFVENFVVLVNVEDGKVAPSEEEVVKATQRCLILDRAYPLPQNYSIN